MPFRTTRIASFALLWFLVALGLSLGGCSWVGFLFESEPIDPAALVGTWEADYSEESDFGLYCNALGLETLEFRSDGTYKQVYHDGRGYEYESSWNAWHLEKRERGTIIHLMDGRFYLLGIQEAEKLANGQSFVYLDDDGRSYPLGLDGSEVILHVFRDDKAPGGFVLEYPPVCDLGGSALMEFYRTSESEPATDSAR